MKIISINALKGGTGKTTTAGNMAYILAAFHGQRVLLIDCDKQGSLSQLFNCYDDKGTEPSLSDVLTVKGYDITKAIKHTLYDGLDILPANMGLLNANMQILLDTAHQQQTRLKKALDQIAEDYDYCVIDCAPDINMATINALVVADEVIIPVKFDRYVISGVVEMIAHIEDMQDFNPKLKIAGALLTMAYRSSVVAEGHIYIQDNDRFTIPVFDTTIRRTTAVDRSTFRGPLHICEPYSTAAEDYKALVTEYLNRANN